MFEALVIALREGLEAALAIGVVMVYIRRMGRADLDKYVYLGLILAIMASVSGAAYIQFLRLDPENEFMEGTVMLVGAVFVGSMVVWMMKTAKNMKTGIEGKIGFIAARRTPLLQGLGLVAFSFMLVFREGIETVLFLTALSLRVSETGNPVLNVISGITGLLLAAVFGVMVLKGMLRVNLKLFFASTGALLLVLVASLLANAVHEFSEIGLLPSSIQELTIIGVLVKEETSMLILIGLVVLPLIMIALDSWKPAHKVVAAHESPSQRRMRIAQERHVRRWKLGFGAVAFIVIMSMGSVWAGSAAQGYDPVPMHIDAHQGKIVVPVNDSGSTFVKYAYQTDKSLVRFFVIRGEDGLPKVALDVCYICPALGYYLAGEELFCKNCGAPINIDSVGLPGGCNPRVLKFSIDGSNIIIESDELEQAAKHFA